MRHGNVQRKFGRETNQRRAFLRSLMRSLVLNGQMKTTLARAKEVRPELEKLLTRAKVNTLANRRALISAIGDEAAVATLMETAKKYDARPGGYLRITKLGERKGDAASMAVISFV